MLAFVVLYRNGWYPPELRSVNLDFDWFYRKPINYAVHGITTYYGSILISLQEFKQNTAKRITTFIYTAHGPKSSIARGASVGSMVIWVAVLLSACLIFYYF